MARTTNRVILAVVFSIGLILTGTSSTSLVETEAPIIAAADTGIYFVQEISPLGNRFVNQVDGYSITVPKEMRVVDMSFTGIRSVLEDEHRRVEIYKETTRPSVSADTYIEYSNRFLNNQNDHVQGHQERLVWNGMTLNIAQWSRQKLTQVAHDQNHYACVDIMTKDAIYTFFFKSDLPLEECGGYQDVIKDFSTFAPTKQVFDAQFKHIASRKWNQETNDFFQKHFSDDSSLQWGIFEPAAPFDMSDLEKLEQRMDYKFPVVLLYSHVQKEYDPHREGQALDDAYAHGKIVELTLQTTPTGGKNMVYDILNGQYDDYLHAYAQDVADFGHPVLFRPFNEMNGDWCSYSAYHTARDTEVFKELYKYIYDIFAEAGAENVIWVWNPNERSFPDFKWNNEVMYYPGDKYVDVVGLTGYNTGTYYGGETWRSFREIYAPLYKKALELYDKPLMITEFASSSVGSSKEQWIQEMFSDIAAFPAIKVAVWWDGCDLDEQGNIARPYFIDETDEIVAIFRNNLPDYKR